MENKTTIGRHSTGEFAFIPHFEDQSRLTEFICSHALDKQIDLYCILETILLDELRAKTDKYHRSIGLAYSMLLGLSGTQDFRNEMLRLGILTSIDRVRWGRRLRL